MSKYFLRQIGSATIQDMVHERSWLWGAQGYESRVLDFGDGLALHWAQQQEASLLSALGSRLGLCRHSSSGSKYKKAQTGTVEGLGFRVQGFRVSVPS